VTALKKSKGKFIPCVSSWKFSFYSKKIKKMKLHRFMKDFFLPDPVNRFPDNSGKFFLFAFVSDFATTGEIYILSRLNVALLSGRKS
jgi:hypothetical protein